MAGDATLHCRPCDKKYRVKEYDAARAYHCLSCTAALEKAIRENLAGLGNGP